MKKKIAALLFAAALLNCPTGIHAAFTVENGSSYNETNTFKLPAFSTSALQVSIPSSDSVPAQVTIWPNGGMVAVGSNSAVNCGDDWLVKSSEPATMFDQQMATDQKLWEINCSSAQAGSPTEVRVKTQTRKVAGQ